MAINFSNPYGLIPQTPSTGTLGLTPQVTPQPPQPPQPQAPMNARNERLGYMLLSLGGALRGQDPLQSFQQVQQLKQQRDIKKQQEEREKRLKALAENNPGFAKMYELFGEKGLSSAFLSQLEAEENQKIRQNQINSFINAGISAEDASLLAAGLSVDDIKSLRSKETTSQNIIDNVSEEVEVVAEETNYADAYSNLDEAFGPADAFQENFLNRPFRFLFGADPAGETGAAVRARNALNLEIKAILAADYTGKPSNLLLQEIEKILPTSTATSEKDAYEKYLNLLQRTKSRAKNLEQGIRSEITSDANKEKYRELLFKTRELEKKLDAAVLSLKPKDKEALEPPEDFGFDPGGRYTGLYTNE